MFFTHLIARHLMDILNTHTLLDDRNHAIYQ